MFGAPQPFPVKVADQHINEEGQVKTTTSLKGQRLRWCAPTELMGTIITFFIENTILKCHIRDLLVDPIQILFL